MIRPKCLELSSYTTNVIRGLQLSTKLPKLRSFLGLCNFFRQLVTNFARIVAPPNQRLRKDQPATFPPLNSGELQAKETLKNVLIYPLILALLYAGGQMTLDTNACNIQIGCVLLQKQPDDTIKTNRVMVPFSQ